MQSTDITARKHGGNSASVEANKRAEPTKAVMRHQIFLWAETRTDFTSKEIAREFGKPLNAISGRISELRATGVIEETGERREGCNVLRVKEAQVNLFG